jgi:hypothetical protein
LLFLFLTEFIPIVCAGENSPEFLWAKQLGGTKENIGEGIVADKAGNIYVTGFLDFENYPSIGTHIWHTKGGKVFLAKYDSTGKLLWLKKASGGRKNKDHAKGYAVAVDDFGYIYVTGYFNGKINFDDIEFVAHGYQDAFLAKYDADGKLIWVRQSGGAGGFVKLGGVAADKKGNVYITGNFVGKAMFGTSETISKSGINPGHQSDVFLVKYDSSGNVLWLCQAGEAGENTGFGVAVDSQENVFIVGRGNVSINFDQTKITNSLEDNLNGFITKYNRDGKVLWAQATAGLYMGERNNIAVDKVGNVFVAGSFNFNPKFGGISLTAKPERNDDIFLVKYDADGKILWGKSAGGTGLDHCLGVATDETGNVYMVGDFMESADFGNIHVQGKPEDSRLGPYSPLFVAKYNSVGDAIWIKTVDKADGYFIKAGMITGLGIAVDANNGIYITGDFGGIYAPISFDSILLKPAGNFFTGKGEDIFVAKLGTGGN